MTTIGLNFSGIKKDKKDRMYIILQPVKDLLPITIDSKKLLCLREVKDRQSDNSPLFTLDMFVPEKNEDTTSS